MSRAAYGHDLMTDNDMEVHWMILMKMMIVIQKHPTVIAGTVSGNWEGEVWVLGEVKALAGPASDLQVRDWRPQVGRKGEKNLEMTLSRLTRCQKKYIRWRTWTSCTVNSRRRARTNIQRFRRWRDQRYRKTLNIFCFSGETWINLVSSCIFWGALAEVSGRAVHSQRGELTSGLWLHEAFHPNQAFSPAAAYNQFDLETADSE